MTIETVIPDQLTHLPDRIASLARELSYLLDKHSIISLSDIAGRIIFLNNKFCEISGYSEKELPGKNHRLPPAITSCQQPVPVTQAAIKKSFVLPGSTST